MRERQRVLARDRRVSKRRQAESSSTAEPRVGSCSGRNPQLRVADASKVPLRQRGAVTIKRPVCRTLAGLQARALPLRQQRGHDGPRIRIGRQGIARNGLRDASVASGLDGGAGATGFDPRAPSIALPAVKQTSLARCAECRSEGDRSGTRAALARVVPDGSCPGCSDRARGWSWRRA